MRRILVIATRQIGDVLLTTPVIRAARQRWPEAKIDVLGFQGTLGMLAGNNDISERIETPARLGWRGFWRLVRQLWRRYDLALVTQPGDRAHLLGFIAAQTRSGLLPEEGGSNWWKRRLLAHAVPMAGDRGDIHVTVEKLALLAPWSDASTAIPVVDPPEGLPLPAGLPLKPGYAVVHAPSMWAYKQWPLENYAEIVRGLLANGVQVALTGSGGAHDQACVSHLRTLGTSPMLIDASGQLNFSQLKTLLEGAAVYIGPDTSVSHLAAATGTPTIAVFGPTNPARWAPWPAQAAARDLFKRSGGRQTAGNVTVLQGSQACVPCGRAGCEDHRDSRSDCLLSIPSAAVLDMALKLVDGRPPAAHPQRVACPLMNPTHALPRPDWIEKSGGVLAVCLGAIVTPYFLIRGWLNAGGTLLALIALGRVMATGSWDALRTNRPLAWVAAALGAPLVLTALSQVVHGEFEVRYLDPPLRLALGGALLVYLHDRRIDWLRAAGLAVPTSLFLCAALIYAPGAGRYDWGERIASYFMDPLMLGQHAAIMGFMSLFLVAPEDTPRQRSLKVAGWIVGLFIALSTGSRTGWMMIPILTLIWLARAGRLRGPRHTVHALFMMAVAAIVLYGASSVVRVRLDQLVADLTAYFSAGDPDTSIGTRLSLYRVAWAAFLERPFTGWGFASVPTPDQLPGTGPLWTPAIQTALVHHGTHSEWLQHMMRMGVLGFLGRAMLYLIPLIMFARVCRAGSGAQRNAGYLGLVVVIGYLTASFTSEVSNLVYLSTFYGLMLAAFGAPAFRTRLS